MRVLYIDIDSLRADHLGCYGYPRPTSPVIDGLAARGMHATRCHTSDAPCVPSRAALFSARFGINNGIVTHNGPAATLRYPGINGSEDMRKPMWMRLLQRYGWETASFSGYAQRHTAWWYGAGFTQNFSCSMPGGHESADQAAAKVNHWLRANGARDEWFLHLTLWDVHTPYFPPQALIDRMAALEPPAAPDRAMVERDIDRWWGDHTPLYWWTDDVPHNPRLPQTEKMPDNIESYEDYLGFLACYDATIAYADEHIGHILEQLDQLGVLDETAVVVSADHGESIGEMGMYFEHMNAGHGTSHVPLVMAWPGRTDGVGAVDALCYQLDLAATVTDLAGYEVPEEWDARSLVPCFDDPAAGRDHLVVGTGLGSYQRAVVTDDHRLVRTIHPGLKPYAPLYLFGKARGFRDELDLEANRQTVVELNHLMLEWHARNTSWPRYSADPFAIEAAAGRSPGMGQRATIEQRMRELGRPDHLAQLEALTAQPEPRTWDSTYETEANPDAQEIRV